MIKSEKKKSFIKICRLGKFNSRPLVIIALGLGLGIFSIMLDSSLFFAAAIVSAILTFLAFGFRKRLLYLFAFFALVGMFRSCTIYPDVYTLQDKSPLVRARVYSTYDNTATLTNVTLNSVKVDGRLLIKNAPNELKADDIVEFHANLEQTTKMSGYVYKFYLLSENITFITKSTDTIIVTGQKNTLHGFFTDIHDFLANKADKLFGYGSPEIKAVLLGDTSEIPDDTLGNLKDAGVSHLFALSGLHVSLLAGIIMLIMNRSNRYVRLAVVTLFLLLYCSICAFPASLTRASLMMLTTSTSFLLDRRTDNLSSLSLAFIIILIFNPYQLFSAGFVLSFLAVLGITLMFNSFEALFSTVTEKWLSKPLAVSMSATSGIMPAMISYFHRFPIYSFVINLVVIPFASAAIVCAFFGLLLGIVFAPLSIPFAFISNTIFSAIERLTAFVTALPFASLKTQSLTLACGILYCLRMVSISPYYIATQRHKIYVSSALTLITFATMFI